MSVYKRQERYKESTRKDRREPEHGERRLEILKPDKTGRSRGRRTAPKLKPHGFLYLP